MKAHELAKELLKNPNYEVKISVDVSNNDDDFNNRAFGEKIHEVMRHNFDNELIIISTGKTNF